MSHEEERRRGHVSDHVQMKWESDKSASCG